MSLARLKRHPFRSLLVIATLALGIGATACVVSAIRGVLLASLPFPAPERLVAIGEQDAESSEFGTVGFTTYDEWKRSLRSFSSVFAVASRSYTLTGSGQAEQLNVLAVTHDAFETLGVRPILGRDFLPEEDVRGAARKLVLSYELWARRFGSDPAVIGRTVRMSDLEFEVIGVMPPRTRLRDVEWRGERNDAWTALRYDTTLAWACRSCRHIFVFGRLRDGVTVDQAARDVETFTAGLRRQYPADYPSRGFTKVVTLQELIVGRQVRSSLWVILAVALLILLIAVSNAAGLRLAEAISRQNELTVRVSLGATPLRIAALLIGESLVQSLLAALLGIGVAHLGITWLRERAAAFLPRSSDLALDPAVVAVCMAIGVLAGMIIGLVPALRARRWSLRDGGRSVVSSHAATQRTLVAVNVALSVALLIGTALLLRSVQKVFATAPGFDAARTVSFRMSIGTNRYEEPAKLMAFYDRFLAQAAQLPGLEAIALTTQLPFAENNDYAGIVAEEQAGRIAAGDAPSAQRFGITSGYFATLRVPVTSGRSFNREEPEPVIILNETAARMLWPDRSGLGKRMKIGGGESPWRRVVGIVSDVAPGELGAKPIAQAYLPLAQFPADEVTGVARGGDAAVLRDLMRRMEPDVAFYRVRTLSSLIADSEARRTFILTCLTSFSFVALALAMIGVYGVLSLLVESRTRELGLRMALGSTGPGVFRLVLTSGLRVVAIALVAGIAASLILGRLLEAFLFGVGNGDVPTLAAVTLFVLATSAVACAIPAWRAARVSPMAALREE